MGGEQSNPDHQGWRVLEVIPNGPCWNKALCVYFDFIVGINGVRLGTSSEEFWDKIQSSQDTEILLTVFNYKSRVKRDISVTPNNRWNGDGLLGVVIVREDFTRCDDQCVRVLSVDDASPASKAGLRAQRDYILGTPINAFDSFSVFRDTVSDYIDQPLPVYVYDSAEATVRLVEVTPSSQWTGEGVLGCQVGDGLLHHIPSLTEKQTEIRYLPHACYVVSSKNSPRKSTHEQTSQSPQNNHTQTPQEQSQPAATSSSASTVSQETASATSPSQEQQDVQGKHAVDFEDSKVAPASGTKTATQTTDMHADTTQCGCGDETHDHDHTQEMLTVRWTDSSHRLPMVDDENAADDMHDNDTQLQQPVQDMDASERPPQQNPLLQRLHQETQQALHQ